MEFECKTQPILRPILNEKGVIAPLCNTCIQVECSNPIKKKSISIFGKTEQWNVYMARDQAYQVTHCAGYME